MTNKFEQLIELFIAEDEAGAKELFHDIVVEKSRDIYESLTDEEQVEETAETEKKQLKNLKKKLKNQILMKQNLAEMQQTI